MLNNKFAKAAVIITGLVAGYAVLAYVSWKRHEKECIEQIKGVFETMATAASIGDVSAQETILFRSAAQECKEFLNKPTFISYCLAINKYNMWCQLRNA